MVFVCNYICSTELGESTLGPFQTCFVVISDGILSVLCLYECYVFFYSVGLFSVVFYAVALRVPVIHQAGNLLV